ncbi:sensor histidine kinase [Thermodesulfobacteriota bacterium B35]
MSSQQFLSTAADLQQVSAELRQKMEEFARHRLSCHHESLLKAFADLVHQQHSLNPFFRLCVSVPPILAGLEAYFYLYGTGSGTFKCVCDSRRGLLEPPRQAETWVRVADAPYEEGDTLVFPLSPGGHGGADHAAPPPVFGGKKSGDPRHDLFAPDPYFVHHSVLGAFAVVPLHRLSGEDRTFLEILCRWIGPKLNNRLIAARHLEHLRFLNALGRDIGHNVIIPNMYLKYLFRQLEKKIEAIRAIEEKARTLAAAKGGPEDCLAMIADCGREREELEACHQDLLKHHAQISLFLESLFRQEHFTLGHLVVQPQKTYVERDIIIPQLELYADRLKAQGITVEKPTNMYEQQFPLMVDVGLLSQVYANLFSNAVKYTREIIDHQGRPRKALAYGSEEVKDFPVPGQTGIKFNVFTTGPPLSEEEKKLIFQEGGRGRNSDGQKGSGHGLDFIRRVIDVHGGKVGVESSDEGNNFYFILPTSPVDVRSRKAGAQKS